MLLQHHTGVLGPCDASQATVLTGSKVPRRRQASRASRRRRYARLATSAAGAASVSRPLPADLGLAPPLPPVNGGGDQPGRWQALAARLSQRLQRTRAEGHLPLCRAFGAASLEELRVRSQPPFPLYPRDGRPLLLVLSLIEHSSQHWP